MLNPRRRLVLASLAMAPLAGCGVLKRSAASDGTGSGPVSNESAWARLAWRYIENNTDYDTGLVGGQDRLTIFTVSNAADALAAIVAAYELGIIDAREFDLRLSRLTGFLATMELSGGKLPNKAYDARSGRMVAFDGNPGDIGWSAIDIGRLLLWLRIVRERHPQHAEYVDKGVLRWSFCEVIDDCGTLYGATRGSEGLQRYQEGRLGYEQLAAQGYAAWGFDVTSAASLARTETTVVDGIAIRHDARDPRTSGAPDAVLTMPYVLLGIELGWSSPRLPPTLKELATSVYRVQEQRWRIAGQFTARSDYQTRQSPYVVLDAVFADGYAWNTVAADGREYAPLALVSTRAAFGMWTLWPGDYTQRLVDSLKWLHDPDRGWYEGRLEAGGAPQANITLATNAAVLECLLYRAKGPLYPDTGRAGLFEHQMQDAFARSGNCLPEAKATCKK